MKIAVDFKESCSEMPVNFGEVLVVNKPDPSIIEAARAEGIAQGKQAEYNAFWDAYQQNGDTRDCDNMFSGRGWTNETFKPKYDIIAQGTYMIFRKTGIVDLGEALKACGKKIVIDNTALQYTFNNTLLEVIDGIEFNKPIGRFDSTFAYSGNLREIKMPLPITKDTLMGNGGFDGCNALEEVRFDGVIGTSGLNLRWSTKLSKASIINIIESLHDNLSGLYLTLSKTAVDNAFETSEGVADGSTSTEWSTLLGERPMWTISLL